LFDLKPYLEERARWINERMIDFIPDIRSFPAALNEAVHYSLFAGGKRLRPILCAASAEALGGNRETALPVACAIEMIHTYSLIHDDLPCMDNDDYRRGSPTNHKVFGENMAVLAGDALLTHAFETLASCARHSDPGLIVRVIHEIAHGAGISGMVAGQAQDVLSEGQAMDPQTLEYIHTHKTGALFRAAVRSGAIMAGAQEQALDALTEYAEAFGLAFQITDDILDVEGDNQKENRRQGTYPALYGMDQARLMVRQAIDKGALALAAFPDDARTPLMALIEYLYDRQI
jgi:geranylgeranyl diphosphate synthase type II